MSKRHIFPFTILLVAAAVFVTAAVVVRADVPKGWILTGSQPVDYETGVDGGQPNQGHPSAFLRSTAPHPEGFGTLMQRISAEEYLGKRVQFSGLVKSGEVSAWAGLWMRMDRANGQQILDNMQDRPIKGTTGWQRYAVVLDVPADATGISFGMLLNGPGGVWLNGVHFEDVGMDVQTTNNHGRKRPVNLDFSE